MWEGPRAVDKMSFPLTQAMRAIGELQGRLAPHCQRLRAAGAVRRKVGDVDELVLVAIPLFREERPAAAPQRSLFGPAPDEEERRVRVNALWAFLDEMTSGSAPRFHGTYRRGERWGERQRQLWWEGYPVELYTTTLDSWGYTLLLRTGPAGFAQRYLQALQRRGVQARGGALARYGRPVPIPGERDAFRLVDWGYKAPQDRGD